ncbi:MAG: DUF2062 domain-containing protein [Planctomycetales bacterium]|nr:DUF2062 domain-containing protein [Planctomycetales bacterium]
MKIVSDKFKLAWQRVKDFCVYRVLHADDPPHRLALGIAVGMFVTFTPLIGFQMMLSFFLAWLLGANKLVGVPLVWISNPFTIIPIYYPCYQLGCQLLGVPVVNEQWKQLGRQWKELLRDPATTWGVKVKFWWEGLMEFVTPLCLGCVVVASVMGILSYYLSLYAIRSYRLRRWGQLMPPSLTPVEKLCPASEAKRIEAASGSEATGGENAA